MKLTLALLILLVAMLFPATARADGIIIPEPPICGPRLCPTPQPCIDLLPCPVPPPSAVLAIRYHHVTVTIQDQVAVTHVDQVFVNPNDWAVEGTYIFPLPAEAAVSSFTLWVDGKPVEGRVLDAAQARQTYEEIVRSLRDPALLEYAGRGAVKASIFPIPPRGERRVELEYTQALTAENGLVRYQYPLNTEKFSAQPLESVTVSVEIRSAVPIRAVYSPSHNLDVSRDGDQHVTAGYEASHVTPDSDFVLYYSLGEEQAFHLLTYRDPADPSDPDGFFLLLLAPKPQALAEGLPKDVVLVLDHSGSMEGDKFRQAQEALRYILSHLNPDDRFNLVSFSTGVETYAGDLRPASEASQALSWVGRLSAQGSTDINRALLEAAGMLSPGVVSERPTYLIFLTDGLPTVGEVDSQRILDNFQSAAPEGLRLFAFGVGYDVDTFLLDSLAQGHHGASSYVLPDERLDEQLSAFYAKISIPVLTDLTLDFGSISAYDLYPSPLPDLFAGSQIVLVGRYRQGGPTTVTLTGRFNGQTQTFQYPEQVFADDPQSEISNQQSSIPRLWATRKIGYLLNHIRLHGPDEETIDQIVRLSIRYGIVTPYTSYLVTEPLPLGAAEQSRIAGEQYGNLLAAPTAAVSGQDAVQKAADQGALAGAEVPAAPDVQDGRQVRILGAHTFVFKDSTWIDTAFDPDKTQTVKVTFLSEQYFALLKDHPDLAAAFSLGQRVIALSNGTAYEVTEAGTAQPSAATPAARTPLPATPVSATPAPSTPASTTPVAKPNSSDPAPGLCGSLLPVFGLAFCFIALKLRKGYVH
jgi:Ca-activated chloride channel family protein